MMFYHQEIVFDVQEAGGAIDSFVTVSKNNEKNSYTFKRIKERKEQKEKAKLSKANNQYPQHN